MPKIDPRIDAYIARSAEFAQPILTRIRKVVHSACPDIEETIKWGMPSFEYKGPMCGMAAFKQHCTLGFWKASLMKDKVLMDNAASEAAMGHLGKITSLKDLPSDKQLKAWVKEAVALNEQGIKVVRAKPNATQPPATPEDLAAALKMNKKALAVYEAFSNSNKREYVDWINEAKTEATRTKRLSTAVEWMSEGKIRNWKYLKC